MKEQTVKKVMAVEEHSVTFNKRDLREVMEQENPENAHAIRQLVPGLVVDFGEGPQLLPSSRVMEALRAYNGEIPEDAELVIAARWRREEEIEIPVAGVTPGFARGHVQHAPAVAQPQPGVPLVLPGVAPPGGNGPACSTCGGYPHAEGPTPECQDPSGCAHVRATKGDLPVQQTVTPTGPGANIGVVGGIGQSASRAQMLTNRETGETAFADKEGRPYGVGYDYTS